MKYIILCFLCLFLISTVSSKHIDQNDFKSSELTDEIPDLDLIKVLIANLTTIENDLIKKKKEKEASVVKLTKTQLDQKVKNTIKEVNEFVQKHQKNLIDKLFNIKSNGYLNSDDEGGIWKGSACDFSFVSIDLTTNFLKRIRIDLIRRNSSDEAAIAEKFINLLNNEISDVFERTDDLIEKYMPSPFKNMDIKQKAAEKMAFTSATEVLVIEMKKVLPEIETDLRKENKTDEANEIKSLLPLLSPLKLPLIELKALNFMHKYTKYWYLGVGPALNSNLKDVNGFIDFIEALYLVVMRLESRFLKKCNKGLIKDKKEVEAQNALKLREELLVKLVDVYETGYFYKSKYRPSF